MYGFVLGSLRTLSGIGVPQVLEIEKQIEQKEVLLLQRRLESLGYGWLIDPAMEFQVFWSRWLSDGKEPRNFMWNLLQISPYVMFAMFNWVAFGRNHMAM